MLHPELKAICDRFIALNVRVKLLDSRHDRSKRNDTWYRAIILLFGLLMFVVGFVGVLDEGLTVENATALALGIPALYILLRAEKDSERIQKEYEQLQSQEEALNQKLRETHSRLRREKEEKLRGSMVLVDWDGRPAISFSAACAYAILEPEGSWVEVDAADVSNSGKVIPDKASFYEAFNRSYPILQHTRISGALWRVLESDETLDWSAYYEKHSKSGERVT